MKMVGLEHEEKMSESFWKERSIKSAPITLTSGGSRLNYWSYDTSGEVPLLL